MRQILLALLAAAAMLLVTTLVFAQPADGRGMGGGRGGGGVMQPAATRNPEQVLRDLKTALNADDEQWKTIEPRLEKVLAARAAVTALDQPGPRGNVTGGRGNPNAPGAAGPRGGNTPRGGAAPRGGGGAGSPPVDPAILKVRDDFQAAFNNPATTDAQLKKATQELLDARAKARRDLDGAQKDLQGALNDRQTAILVTRGYFN